MILRWACWLVNGSKVTAPYPILFTSSWRRLPFLSSMALWRAPLWCSYILPRYALECGIKLGEVGIPLCGLARLPKSVPRPIRWHPRSLERLDETFAVGADVVVTALTIFVPT